MKVLRGHVKGGVVVLEKGTQLPEGQEVSILAPTSANGTPDAGRKHSVMDIPTVKLGAIIDLLGKEDLLGEMVEGRQ